jgi:membrane protease YdiL (CAAX protease family)
MTTARELHMAQSSHPGWSLSRVIYAIAGVIAVWFALGLYDGSIVSRYILTKNPATFSSLYHVVVATPFIYILTLASAICLFRPVGNLFQWNDRPARFSWRSIANHVLLGISAGLLVSILSAPFPIIHKHTQLLDVAEHLSGSNSAFLLIPIFILLVSAIAICTELFFRGFVLRTLANYSNLSSSVIASSLLSGYLWSFDRPAVTVVILGAVSGTLFFKTRSLIPSILAGIVFLSAAPLCSEIFHRLAG